MNPHMEILNRLLHICWPMLLCKISEGDDQKHYVFSHASIDCSFDEGFTSTHGHLHAAVPIVGQAEPALLLATRLITSKPD